MTSFLTLVSWFDRNAAMIALVLGILTAILRLVFAIVSRVAQPYPRLKALVETVAAASPDVLRALGQLFKLATGRDLPAASGSIPPASEVELLRAELERMKAEASTLPRPVVPSAIPPSSTSSN